MNLPDFNLSPQIPQRTLDSINAMSRSMAEQNRRKSEAINSTNFLASFQRANLASELANQLLSQISRFDAELDADHEVGIKLVSFGQSITFHVVNFGYYNPSLIVFSGLTEDENRVELVQHVSQISFLLLALPKLHPDQPKRKIGFIQEDSRDTSTVDS
jgi:hypothetical protein